VREAATMQTWEGRVVVMGVAGSGKSAVGGALAAALGAQFVDADSLHPDANVAKMSAGVPLTDDDRWPWLERVRDVIAAESAVVVACSALRRRYRDVLRGAAGVRFVLLDVDRATATERATHREGHFMGAGMVASQFEALERPAGDEADVLVLDASPPVDDVVAAVVAAL
jgi:gluconokinase